MARTKQQLIVDNNTSFPNNNTNYITPAILREYNRNVIDSLVDEIPFGEYTQSVAVSIENLNNFTGSLEASYVTTGSFNSYTSSNNEKWNTLGGQTGSYLSTTATGSLLVTASAASNVITFTKGNGDTFDVTVADTTDLSSLNAFTASATISLNALNVSSASQQVSINALNQYTASQSTASIVSSITQLNAFTASQDTKNSTLATYTASVDSSLSNLNSFSASQLTKDATLATYTGSNDTKWSNLGSQSGSWITESETGSFAKLDATQTFTGINTFTNEMTASAAKFSSIETGTLTATTIHTITESSSVIYSSGSNIFGDAADDTQTLYGHVNAVNSFTASGLIYPSADNGVKSFIQTDGAGNLSLQYVDALNDTIRSGESTTILKGTPLFVSGALGANPIVYIAQAADASKMPATYVAAEDITAGGSGRGIVLGEIDAIDTTGYPAGTLVYVSATGGWTSTRPTGANTIIQPLGIVTKEGSGGKGLVLNPGPVLLPNIQTGYMWVGDANNQPIAISTGSFVKEDETGSFAQLGASQVFTGNNTFTGNTVVSQSAAFGTASFYGPVVIDKGISGNGNISLNGNIVANKVGAFDFDSIYLGSQLGGTTANGTFFGYGSTDYTATLGAYAGGFDNELQTYVDSTGIYLKDFNGGGYNTFLQLLPNTGTNPAPILTRGVEITGSVKLTPASVSTSAQYPLVFMSGSTISKDSVDTLFYNPSSNLLQVSASSGVVQFGTVSLNVISGSGNVQYSSAVSRNSITQNSAGRFIAMSGWPAQLGAPSLTNATNPAILAMSSSGQPYSVIELQHSASFTDGRVTVMKPLVALQNLEVTGSLTASLQSGYTWVGDGNNKTTLLSTSSFATTLGSNTFYGDQTISGSVYVSGSINLRGEGADGFAFSGKALYLTNSVQTGITVESPIHFYQVSKGDFYITNNVAGVGSGSMNMIAANNANLNVSASNVVITAGNKTTINNGDFQVGKDPTADIYNGFKVDRNGADLNNYAIYNLATSSAILDLGAVDGTGFSYSTELFVEATPSAVTFKDFSVGDYAYHDWMKIPQNTGSNPKPIMTRGLEVTGSVDITGSLKATGELKFGVGANLPFGTVDASDQPYILNNSLIHSNSIIMLTLKSFSGGGTEPTLYVAGQNEGSASIGFTNDSAAFSFNYMIINPA